MDFTKGSASVNGCRGNLTSYQTIRPVLLPVPTLNDPQIGRLDSVATSDVNQCSILLKPKVLSSLKPQISSD